MKMEVWTDFRKELRKTSQVFVGEEKKEFIVQSFRQIKYGYLIHFINMQTLEDTQDLQNKVVYVKAQDSPHLKSINIIIIRLLVWMYSILKGTT